MPSVVRPAVTGASLPRRCAGVSFSYQSFIWEKGGEEERRGVVSSPDPTLPRGEQSGEQSQISWASAQCRLVTHFTLNLLKKGTDTRDQKFYGCKGSELPVSQSHWSLPLLDNKTKKFHFVHQTVSHWEACGLGTRLGGGGERRERYFFSLQLEGMLVNLSICLWLLTEVLEPHQYCKHGLGDPGRHVGDGKTLRPIFVMPV